MKTIDETPSGRPNSLRRREVRATLDRLHKAARGDWWRGMRVLPGVLFGMLRGRSFGESLTPNAARDIYMPISRAQGEFLYLVARTIGARRAVEFGTSFGISTIYLASAIRDNGGDSVIGTELEPSKHRQAEANVKEAGLEAITDIRLGDALRTLRDVPEPLDLVLIDGWKDLSLPVLGLLKPRLRPGAVVLTDNIFTFKKALRPYVDHMPSGEHGFESTTLPFSSGFEYSVYLGDGPGSRI